LADLEVYYAHYQQREPHVQRFETFTDYQAESWPHPRRIVAKIEINRHGTNRRFVVTTLTGSPQAIYQDCYVQRGNVPERPLGELKNGLHADRLSCHRFCANAFRLLEHVTAYALVVLFREAAADVPAVATATVSTLRQRLWKVGALVRVSARRIWFALSETWPCWQLWVEVTTAVHQFVASLRPSGGSGPPHAAVLPM
jgi:hypothetical protein